MKAIVDKETGFLGLIPESDKDRLLLYHLMNCSDLKNLPEYLKTVDDTDMTVDLGITYDRFYEYLDPLSPVVQRADIAPARETGRLIGFNRDSSLRGSLGNLVRQKIR